MFGNSYSGFFSYDDDLVTDGDSEVELSNFEFLFDGTTYTKNDALLAVAVFSDRVFLGIEYLANNLPDSPQITFLPKEDIFGFIEPPFFGYELASAEQGTGEITFTLRPPSPVSVPEPSAILGLLGFGFLGLNLNPSASSFPRPKAKK